MVSLQAEVKNSVDRSLQFNFCHENNLPVWSCSLLLTSAVSVSTPIFANYCPAYEPSPTRGLPYFRRAKQRHFYRNSLQISSKCRCNSAHRIHRFLKEAKFYNDWGATSSSYRGNLRLVLVLVRESRSWALSRCSEKCPPLQHLSRLADDHKAQTMYCVCKTANSQVNV